MSDFPSARPPPSSGPAASSDLADDMDDADSPLNSQRPPPPPQDHPTTPTPSHQGHGGVGAPSPKAPQRRAYACDDGALLLDWSRDDERRFNELKKRHAGNGTPLSAAEQSELALLSQRHEQFMDDGIRRLQAGAADREEQLRQGDSMMEAVGSAMHGVARGALFWGSLLGTAGPGYFGKKLGLTTEFRHWNWITDRLILGAIPVVTQVGTSGNHLSTIRSQCDQRQVRLGLVVSAITQDELDGFGIVFPRFAQQRDWAQQLDVRHFELLPIADMTAQTDFDSVRLAVDHIHKVITERDEAVYVHCKAGKGRSWMVVMCYLCVHAHLSYDDADTLVRAKRHQVSPSAPQRKFVHDFVAQYTARVHALKRMHEHGLAQAGKGNLRATSFEELAGAAAAESEWAEVEES